MDVSLRMELELPEILLEVGGEIIRDKFLLKYPALKTELVEIIEELLLTGVKVKSTGIVVWDKPYKDLEGCERKQGSVISLDQDAKKYVKEFKGPEVYEGLRSGKRVTLSKHEEFECFGHECICLECHHEDHFCVSADTGPCSVCEGKIQDIRKPEDGFCVPEEEDGGQ